MNTIFFRQGVLWPSLAAVAVLGTGLSATAQTVDQAQNQQLTESSVTATPSTDLSAKLKANRQNFSTETTTNTNQASVSDVTALQQFPSANTQATGDRIPVPGTVATSSMALVPEYAEPTSSTSQLSAPKVAQSDIDLGRPTRGGSSYIGVAGNIGIDGGQSSLGDGNFAVISKVGLTNAISVRPSAIFGDNTTILIPVTYDFAFQQTDPFSEPLAIAPYVGIGAAINTGDNSQVGFLASGGVDVPLNSQFTATAAKLLSI